MRIFSLFLFCSLLASGVMAQPAFTSVKGGHVFEISIPSYMTRTTGLNSSAILQFKNTPKDIYAIVIDDDKEEMRLADLDFATIEDFHAYTMKNFLKDEPQRNIGEAVKKTIGSFNYMEADASYYDGDAKTFIIFLESLKQRPVSTRCYVLLHLRIRISINRFFSRSCIVFTTKP